MESLKQRGRAEIVDARPVAMAAVMSPPIQFDPLSSDEVATLFTENLHDYALFGIDLRGKITSWNPGVKRILGYDESEFIGQNATLIFTPEDNAIGVPEGELANALHNGRATDERRHQRRDGSRFWASGMMILLADAEGKPRGFAKIMRDRTEMKLAELERERLLKDEQQARKDAEEARAIAEAANLSKDRFISLISHEMRTPLTTLQGWLSLLRMGGLGEDAHERALQTMDRNVHMIVHLVNDLLDIERIRSDKLHLEILPVELLPVIAAAVESILPEAGLKLIRIRTKVPPEPLLVMGDEARLQQILLNLLSNAVKFTQDGGEIEVRLESHDVKVEIQVSDNGCGIEPEFMPHVFEQFRQSEDPDSRHHGGLGLGLSIVQNLVQLQGGTIEAESDGLGQGARFIVSFPLYKPAPGETRLP